MSTLWKWPWQVTETWTANGVVPFHLHPAYLSRYNFIRSSITSKFSRSSDMVVSFAKKTTRSASDFPFTAVPFPSDPLYNTTKDFHRLQHDFQFIHKSVVFNHRLRIPYLTDKWVLYQLITDIFNSKFVHNRVCSLILKDQWPFD